MSRKAWFCVLSCFSSFTLSSLLQRRTIYTAIAVQRRQQANSQDKKRRGGVAPEGADGVALLDCSGQSDAARSLRSTQIQQLHCPT